MNTMNASIKAVLLFFLLNTGLLLTNIAYSEDSPKARISLISNLDSLKSEAIPVLGVHFILPAGWETFWRNPGDVGFGVKFDWNGSDNIKNIEVLWPIPEHLDSFGYHLNVYKNNVLFPVMVTVIDTNKPINAKLKVEYLLCQPGACIPHEAQLDLLVPVGHAKTNKNAALIDAALKTVPSSTNANLIALTATKIESIDEKAASLRIDFKTTKPLNKPDLFVEGSKDLAFAPPQVIKVNPNEGYFLIKVTKNDLSDSAKSLSQLLDEPLMFTLINDHQAITVEKTVK